MSKVDGISGKLRNKHSKLGKIAQKFALTGESKAKGRYSTWGITARWWWYIIVSTIFFFFQKFRKGGGLGGVFVSKGEFLAKGQVNF